MFRFFADSLLLEQMGPRLIFWFHFAINSILKFFRFVFEIFLISFQLIIKDDVLLEI
jgi:hypothetical protein